MRKSSASYGLSLTITSVPYSQAESLVASLSMAVCLDIILISSFTICFLHSLDFLPSFTSKSFAWSEASLIKRLFTASASSLCERHACPGAPLGAGRNSCSRPSERAFEVNRSRKSGNDPAKTRIAIPRWKEPVLASTCNTHSLPATEPTIVH